jgi:hypothetical protein
MYVICLTLIHTLAPLTERNHSRAFRQHLRPRVPAGVVPARPPPVGERLAFMYTLEPRSPLFALFRQVLPAVPCEGPRAPGAGACAAGLGMALPRGRGRRRIWGMILCRTLILLRRRKFFVCIVDFSGRAILLKSYAVCIIVKTFRGARDPAVSLPSFSENSRFVRGNIC